MKRDVMREWTRAWARSGAATRSAWAEVFAAQRRQMLRFETAPSPGGVRGTAVALRATRPLAVRLGGDVERGDLERAVLILQRNNRLLRARFGVDWPAAASVVAGEASRRGATATSLARVLAAGLRRDARAGGAR